MENRNFVLCALAVFALGACADGSVKTKTGIEIEGSQIGGNVTQTTGDTSTAATNSTSVPINIALDPKSIAALFGAGIALPVEVDDDIVDAVRGEIANNNIYSEGQVAQIEDVLEQCGNADTECQITEDDGS